MAAVAPSTRSLVLATHATRWDEVRDFGKVLPERLPSGKVRFRIDFGTIDGKRYILNGEPRADGRRRRFKDVADAEETLLAIRGDMVARSITKAQALALWFEKGPAPEDLIGARTERYLSHFRALVREGQRSPTSLRELERYAEEGGHWSWWSERPIQGIAYADVDDWHRWLATRGISAKTRKNVSDAFRAMLRWWKARDESITVPKFEPIKVRRYVPTLISMEDQARILEAIPYERRGAFLVAAYEALRLSEIRALDLSDYADGKLRVTKTQQGPRLDAPIADLTKNNAGEVRDVWHPDLRAWLDWRLERAAEDARKAKAEGRIYGAVALFWNPTARNKARRWTPDPMEREWHRAAKVAGVEVPLQEGTRHAILTQLGEHLNRTVLRAFSRHKSDKSLDHYSQPRPKPAAIVRAIRGTE